MKPILVHVHVYYTELWKELESCLHNLVAYPCEIYVTYVKNDAAFEAQVRAFGHGISLIKVENSGYDIAPFLHVLRQVDLRKYSYVAKLHTKRDMPEHMWLEGRSAIGESKWRDYLLEPFSKPETLTCCLHALETTPQLGMVAHHRIILRRRQDKSHAGAYHLITAFCAQNHISLKNAKFVAGSMFICKVHPLERIVGIVEKEQLTFDNPDPRHVRVDSAHVLERVLGYIFTSEGLEIRDVFSTRKERFLSVLHTLCHISHVIVWQIFRFIFQIKRTKSDRFIVKLLRAPVWWGKVERRSSAHTEEISSGPVQEHSEQKSVLLVSHDLALGGAPVVLLWLAEYLQKKGYKVDLWSIRGGVLEESFNNIGIKVQYVADCRTEIRRAYIRQKTPYELIICNTVLTYRYVDALQRFKTPVVWYIHESGLVKQFVANNSDAMGVLENFYNIYTVSELAAESIREYNQHVKVIPNFVLDDFREYACHGDRVVFGFLGCVAEHKGIDTLICAFEKLQQTHPQCELLIAGICPDAFAEELRRRTSGNSSIHWLGEVQGEEKEKFFDSIDVLCAPSVYDSCSLSVLEAAMKGKAIVTTYTTGAHYVVKEASSGYVIPPENEEMLHARMETLAAHPSMVAEMQKVSREMYLQKVSEQGAMHSIDQMLSENEGKLPVITTPIWHKMKLANGKREIRFMGHRLCRYTSKRKRNEPKIKKTNEKVVLFCVDKVVMGGIAKVLLNYLSQLSIMGYKCKVASLQDVCDSYFLQHFADLSIEFRVVGVYAPPRKRRNFLTRWIYKMRREAAKAATRLTISEYAQGCDVVVDFYNFCFSSYLTKLPQRKIGVCHGSIIFFKKAVLKDNIGNYDRFVCLSEAFVRDFKRLYPEWGAKICCLYNPIDVEGLRHLGTSETTACPTPYFVAVQRLEEDKDVETIIRAFRVFREKNQSFYLVIVGDGPQRADLEKFAARDVANGDIIFTGRLDNPYPLIRAARALILSSTLTVGEGLPTVLIEAQALGVPAVSSDVPSGPAEILMHGEAGYLFEAGNPESLAQVLEDIERHPEEREKKICKATENLVRFSPSRAISRLEEIIQTADL